MRRAFLIAIGFLLGPGNAHSECPLNSIECNGVITTRDSHYSTQCLGAGLQDGNAFVDYDLQSGLLHGRVIAFSQGWRGFMDLFDEYVLLAPDDGNPVDVQVEYHVTALFTRGQSSGGGTFQAYFRTAEENGPNFFKRVFATTATDTVLIWPLRLRPGVPLVIHGSLLVDALKGANEAEVRFKFTHLPTGATISSCQGFQTEQPVPAIDETWGRLRASYR